ncbi:hypothetical protein [Cellulomonas sp. P5_C5]
MSDDLPRSLTEAAPILSELLGRPVSRSLIYEWEAAGRLPTYLDHLDRVRVRVADLEAFAARERAAHDWEQPQLLEGL